MARTLVLVRHAKSAWPQDTPDFQRPLARRGRRDAPAVGRWLRRHVPRLDLVVCSPAERARQTWDLAAAQLDGAPPVRHDERLYHSSAEMLRQVTAELPAEAQAVLFVGHNPGLEHFLRLLTGAVEVLKTSAIVVLSAPGTWQHPGGWTLEELATPRGD